MIKIKENNFHFKTNAKELLLAFILLISLFNSYIFSNYTFGDVTIKSISLETNIHPNDILVYTSSVDDFRIDFSKPFKGKKKGDQVQFDLGIQDTRSFGIYVGMEDDLLFLKNVRLTTLNTVEVLNFSDFESKGMHIRDKNNAYERHFSSELNGYFKLKKSRITKIEFLKIELISLVLGLLVLFLISTFLSTFSFGILKSLQFKQTLVSVFLVSIFLPQPLFNIAFMGSFVLIIRDFNFRTLLSNKTGLLFLGYFMWFLLNNLLFSSSFNVPLLETLLPIFCLPVYFACAPKGNYLQVFPVSAFLLTLYFFSTSILEVFVFSNLSYLSFDAFTKYLHPVYFSYLLFFSIVYLELNPTLFYRKNGILITLLIALFLCGSKLIIGLTLLFYLYKILTKKVYMSFAFIVFLIVAIFIFPPTRKRFMEVSNLNDLSILSDPTITSFHDSRLNGLTLRLVIWQETLSALNNPMELIFGKGVDEQADVLLQNRLTKRGLEVGHSKYDPHNQYITSLYKFGVLGLSFLILTCLHLFFTGFKSRNTLMIFSILLFTLAMLAESVLQRIVGINFFISILLLLSVQLTEEFKN